MEKMKENVPPEERLLRLIRGQDKQEKEIKKVPVVLEAASSNTAQVSLSKVITKRTFGKNDSLSKLFSLKFFNFLLLVLALGLTGYLGREIFSLWKEGKNVSPLGFRPTKITLAEEDKKIEEEALKPYSYYSQEIGKKELFKSSVLQGQETQTTALAPTINEMSANLILLGIVLDEQPQAIIEDSKTKKTYFLYKGDNIGEIKVEDIQENKVVLSYQGEKIELVP
jgi:hypothetical protein